MAWLKRAPTAEGYYWFLPSQVDMGGGRLSKQDPPVIAHREVELDYYTCSGNDMTFEAKELKGLWWSEPIRPPSAIT